MTTEEQILPQDIFFRLSRAGDSLCEIYKLQLTIVKLVEQGVFKGGVLDIVCGITDIAVYIAQHVKNVDITAIDLVCLAFFSSEMNEYPSGTQSH